MITLATIGVRIRVTPCAELEVRLSEQDADNYINDPTPFEFLVEGRLEDGLILYGLYGPVISGPERHHNLICNLLVRYEDSDWRISSKGWANFKVGPTKATRCHPHAFWHPAGTDLSGFPHIPDMVKLASYQQETRSSRRICIPRLTSDEATLCSTSSSVQTGWIEVSRWDTAE